MWHEFTKHANRAWGYAQEEAKQLGASFVSTEHLLLGLIRDHNVARVVLERLGVSNEDLRSKIEPHMTPGDGNIDGKAQLTPGAKRVLDFSYDEAQRMNSNYIGSEHILLGLIREGEGIAGKVLHDLGLDLVKTRAEVQRLQSGEAPLTPQ